MRVLVHTDDRVGPAMAGSALRAWELARVLAAAGHRVRLAAAPGSTALAPDGPEVTTRARWSRTDAVLAAPWHLPPLAFLGSRLLVVDGVTPLLAELAAAPPTREVLERRRTAAARLPLALARADAILAAGEAQRAWWRTRLAAVGRDGVPVLDVPFGIPAEDPPPERDDIPGVPTGWAVALWWGGVWPWLDLDTLLGARARLARAALSVVVPVAARPGAAVPRLDGEALLEKAASHGLKPPQVVPLEHWVPYGERHRVLNRASLLVVLHRAGAEARLAFRTRAMDGLWAGVPLLLSEGGAVAEIARRESWGGVVAAGDETGVAAALELLLGETQQRRCRASLVSSRPAWRWPRVAAPLLAALPELPLAPHGSVVRASVSAAALLAGRPGFPVRHGEGP